MSAKTGKNWKIKRYVDGTNDTHLGGLASASEPRLEPELVEEAVTGQYQLESLKAVFVKPLVTVTLKPRRLESYVADYDGTNKYCFVSAEDALSSHTLALTDGIDTVKLENALVNSCELTLRQRGSLEAAIEVWAKTRATLSPWGNDPTLPTEAPMDKSSLNTLSIGGTDVKADFQELTMRVNHNLGAEPLGTGLTPAEVWQKQTVYDIRVVRGLKTQSFAASAYAGTKQDIIVQLNDGQTTPRKTKFTFVDAVISAEAKPVRELDLIMERIEARCRKLTLVAGT